MKKQYPTQYKFFPRTYILPSEYFEFKANLQKKKLPKPVYIAKPEASCQGRGIFLTNNANDIEPEDFYVV